MKAIKKVTGAPAIPPLNLVSMKGTNNNNKLQPRTTRTATLRKLKLRNSVMNMPSVPMNSVPIMAKRAQSTSNLLIDQNNTTKYKSKK